jgi:DNA modification methylase
MCEMAWVSRKSPAKLFRKHVVSIEKYHPTTKPTDLMMWCLQFFPEADLILDPFCGSGTTLVAAKMLGRRYIGVDIEKKYCDIAEERLRNTTPPLPFVTEKMEQNALGI